MSLFQTLLAGNRVQLPGFPVGVGTGVETGVAVGVGLGVAVGVGLGVGVGVAWGVAVGRGVWRGLAAGAPAEPGGRCTATAGSAPTPRVSKARPQRRGKEAAP